MPQSIPYDPDNTPPDLFPTMEMLVKSLVDIGLKQHQQRFPIQGLLQEQILPYAARTRQTIQLPRVAPWNPYGGKQALTIPEVPSSVREPLTPNAAMPINPRLSGGANQYQPPRIPALESIVPRGMPYHYDIEKKKHEFGQP